MSGRLIQKKTVVPEGFPYELEEYHDGMLQAPLESFYLHIGVSERVCSYCGNTQNVSNWKPKRFTCVQCETEQTL